MNARLDARIALLMAAVACAPAVAADDAPSSPDDSVSSGELSAGVARVTTVRLFVDGREYEWTEDALVMAGEPDDADASGEADKADKADETAAGDSIRADTVVSFLRVRPGMRIRPDDAEGLDRLCRESELALADSGYFYDATVQALPARKNPLERTVLVTVMTGFLWRFGGGNAWGLVGKDAIGGGRNSLRAYVGWNRNGVSYTDYRAFGLPLALGGSLFAYAPGRYRGMDSVAGNPDAERAASAGILAGWFVRPDVLVSVEAVAGPDSFSRDAEWRWSLQPAASWRKYLVPGDPERYGNESDVGVDARAFYFPSDGARKAEASALIHGRASESTALAVKAACGTSDGNVGFDLYMTEDRSVRSGWRADELYARTFAFASVEARRRVVSFMVPPGFACDVQAFAFSDAALVRADGDAAVPDAYGAGLRILFDNPVFAYFSFSYGVSREGNGRFMFSGSAGF